MMGVAQVIGMKPTLRSFFSRAAPSANSSVAVLIGKNCESAASAVEAPTDFKKGAPRGVLGKHCPHHGGRHYALVTLVVPLNRLAAQRALAMRVFGGRAMPAADAASLQLALGVERIVECGHAAPPCHTRTAEARF